MSIIFGCVFTRRKASTFVSIKKSFSTESSCGKADLTITSQERLFRYTSGRWLYNEELQLERRHVKFNVAALRDMACRALSAPFSRMTKLPEGLYNKVFSLASDTGEEILLESLTLRLGPHITWLPAKLPPLTLYVAFSLPWDRLF
jgi:hypothetical protein